MINWTLLRKKFGLNKASEKFEELALYYVQDVYPNYNWEPTPPKGDGNRDIQIKSSDNNEYDVWAEAKYRNSQEKDINSKRSLERKDIDSTILSGLIYGRVRLIIFISNARLPNTVMNRAILGARIRGIEVTAALAEQLENWLIEHPNIYKIIFDEELMVSKERTDSPVISFKSAMFYDPVSTDFLPLNKKKNSLLEN